MLKRNDCGNAAEDSHVVRYVDDHDRSRLTLK